MKRYFVFGLIFIALMLSWQQADAQCSMCSAVVSSNMEQEAEATATGINKGILFLMAFPYLLLMGFVYVFYKDKIRAFAGRFFRN